MLYCELLYCEQVLYRPVPSTKHYDTGVYLSVPWLLPFRSTAVQPCTKATLVAY